MREASMNTPTNKKILTQRPHDTTEQAHVSSAQPVDRIRSAPEKRRIRAHYEALIAALEGDLHGNA
jgi:hypothetical protein